MGTRKMGVHPSSCGFWRCPSAWSRYNGTCHHYNTGSGTCASCFGNTYTLTVNEVSSNPRNHHVQCHLHSGYFGYLQPTKQLHQCGCLQGCNLR